MKLEKVKCLDCEIVFEVEIEQNADVWLLITESENIHNEQSKHCKINHQARIYPLKQIEREKRENDKRTTNYR
jgi:hypothetical protein